MKVTLPACFAATFLCLLTPVSSARGDRPTAVRQRFVPASGDTAKGNGASFSALHHLVADDPGVSMLMAHAGVGDSFPVQEEQGPKLFEVAVVGGDDDLLKLEVRRPEGMAKHDLKRDGTIWVEAAGTWF